MLRPSVHMLPGTGWCGAGPPPLPTACWWLTYPVARTGVCCRQRDCMYVSSQPASTSPGISRVRVICCVGSHCSAGSRPGISKEMVSLRSSWFQSLQRFYSLICGSRMSSCILLRFVAKWLRFCLFSLFLVVVTSLWSGWPGSLQIFSVWIRTLNVLWSSRDSRSAVFSISLMGVVFMAQRIAHSATFWTSSTLLLLAFEAVAQEVCGIPYDGTDCSCVDPWHDVCMSPTSFPSQFL